MINNAILLKDKYSIEPGFQYVIDNLELMSTAGRRSLMHQPWLTDCQQLYAEHDNISLIVNILRNGTLPQQVIHLRHQLMQLHDIQGTLHNLQHHTILDEVQLYEIKLLAHLTNETAKAATELGINDILSLPDLSEVFRLLDPDNTQIAHFYVYDSYHPELAIIRKELKSKQMQLDKLSIFEHHDDDETKLSLQKTINDLFEQQTKIQEQVIVQLTEKLRPYVDILSTAMERMAYTDLLFAKSTLAMEWNLCAPTFNDGTVTRYTALFNPRLMHRNAELGLRYQPIDVEIDEGVCLITGANMAGKTVLLKTMGIAQLLAQFGFFVPATTATLQLVDDVIFCIGDEQNEMNGLSSFASEIMKISDTLQRSQSERLLILIDELARTTNPVEGKSIVQAVATILQQRNSITLVTTHYSQLGLNCQRLRVRGFVETLSDKPLTPENINQFMDYSLIADNTDDVPQDALRIATILGCDKGLIDLAKKKLTE